MRRPVLLAGRADSGDGCFVLSERRSTLGASRATLPTSRAPVGVGRAALISRSAALMAGYAAVIPGAAAPMLGRAAPTVIASAAGASRATFGVASSALRTCRAAPGAGPSPLRTPRSSPGVSHAILGMMRRHRAPARLAPLRSAPRPERSHRLARRDFESLVDHLAEIGRSPISVLERVESMAHERRRLGRSGAQARRRRGLILLTLLLLATRRDAIVREMRPLRRSAAGATIAIQKRFAARAEGAAFAVVFAVLGGCGEERAPAADLPLDVPPVVEGDWYRPGAAITWQWQLAGTVNTSYAAELFDIDLFESPQSLIDDLHAAGRKVLCYFSAGSSEDWRPDHGQIDPAARGEPLDGWEGERWLDVRAQSVVDMVERRLDLAVAKACDGVEPDNVDGFANDTGFDLSGRDQLAFNRFVANAAHRRGLAVALKNDGDQAPDLVSYYDLELDEQCHEYDECAPLAVFVAAHKPILNAEYTHDAGTAQMLASTLCPAARAENIRTLILPLALDDAFRVACD